MHLAVLIDSMHGGGAELSVIQVVDALLNRGGNKVDLILLDYHGPRLSRIPETANLFILDRRFPEKKDGEECSIPLDRIQWISEPKRRCDVRSMVHYLKTLKRPGSDWLRPRLRHYYWTASMAHYLENEKPDLVWSNLFHSNAVSILGKRYASDKTPVIWTMHIDIALSLNQNNLQYTKRLLPEADHIHAVSQGVAESVLEFVPKVRDRVTVLFNPLDTDGLSLAAETIDHPWYQQRSSSDRGLNVMPVKIVLAAGRLVEQKNFTMLVEAFAMLRKNDDVRLVILGEGPEREKIKQAADSLGVSEFVSLPGWTDNPYAFMSRSDLFVLSSSWEGLPGVLVQALACGCPVVSTDCPHGAREILGDGRYGRLVPVDNPEALSEAIAKTLDEGVDGERLRQRAMSFLPDRLVEEYENMFEGVIAAAAENHR